MHPDVTDELGRRRHVVHERVLPHLARDARAVRHDWRRFALRTGPTRGVSSLRTMLCVALLREIPRMRTSS